MTLAHGLNELLLALYRASRELPLEEFQSAAISLIQPWLRFDFAQWGSSPIAPTAVTKRLVHQFNEGPEAITAYEEIKHQDTVAEIAWKTRSGVLSYSPDEMFASRDKAGVREYTRRFRHHNNLLWYDVDHARAFVRWASLYRASPSRRYLDGDADLARFLVPHLFEALTINRLTSLEHVRDGGLRRHYHLAIADRDGGLVHAEAGFMALLREEFGSLATACLPDPCRAAIVDRGRYVGRALVVLVVRPCELLFLKARPVCPADGLSRREREVAEQLAAGATYKTLARALNMAPATARNHMDAIRRKLGIHKAAELRAHLDAAD
ncbi:MAG: helix-turn-helix transcriptional regulator [Burkholderiales bacterium]|nr:helix-turn-helix transcriptional regulator [Burkholderiales bacterium]